MPRNLRRRRAREATAHYSKGYVLLYTPSNPPVSAWLQAGPGESSWLAPLTDPRPVIITLATRGHRRRQPATSTCLGCIFQGCQPLCSQTSPRQHCTFGDVSFCAMQFPTPERHTSQTRERERPVTGNNTTVEKASSSRTLTWLNHGAKGPASRAQLTGEGGLAAFCGAVQCSGPQFCSWRVSSWRCCCRSGFGCQGARLWFGPGPGAPSHHDH